MSSRLITKAFAASVHKAREMRPDRMMDIFAMLEQEYQDNSGWNETRSHHQTKDMGIA